MKKTFILIILLFLTSCDSVITDEPIIDVEPNDYELYSTPNCDIYDESCDEAVQTLLDSLTLDEKLGQMIQGERAYVTPEDVKTYNLGSVLAGGGSHPNDYTDTYQDWYDMVMDYQNAAVTSSSGISIIFGTDAVHGHNNVYDMTIFPHQINLGAARNESLVYDISKATAHQLLSTGITWNFAPSLSVVQNIGWGRTYEGYSEHPSIHQMLTASAIQGYQEYGVVATAKHFFGDGGTNGVDQGNAIMEDQQTIDMHLSPYVEAVDAGVKTIMASYNSVNGIKMHGYEYWIQDILKDNMGFKGFIISDWNAIHQLPGSFYDQVVSSVNAGVDMLMEPTDWLQALDILKQAVSNQDITIARIDDAVSRILAVKLSTNLISDPTFQLDYTDALQLEHEALARQAVRESMVLLKHEHNTLPLLNTTKVFITGPAADHIGYMSGGWTTFWQGNDNADIGVGTSLLDGLSPYVDITSYDDADTIIIALTETPYAEGYGDQGNPTLTSGNAHPQNMDALNTAIQAKADGKQVIAILFSGRPLILDQYMNYFDVLVAAFLPGSEGGSGLADVLTGRYPFTGKLPYTWPKDASQLGYVSTMTNYDTQTPLFPFNFGLTLTID